MLELGVYGILYARYGTLVSERTAANIAYQWDTSLQAIYESGLAKLHETGNLYTRELANAIERLKGIPTQKRGSK